VSGCDPLETTGFELGLVSLAGFHHGDFYVAWKPKRKIEVFLTDD
jgi:hypothetical protein